MASRLYHCAPFFEVSIRDSLPEKSGKRVQRFLLVHLHLLQSIPLFDKKEQDQVDQKWKISERPKRKNRYIPYLLCQKFGEFIICYFGCLRARLILVS